MELQRVRPGPGGGLSPRRARNLLLIRWVNEAKAVRLAAAGAALMIAQQTAGRAVRDALFLSELSAERLPGAMLAAAAVSVFVVFAWSRLVERRGPQGPVPAVFALSAVLFAAEGFLLEAHPGFVALALFLHIAVLSAVAISGFWSVVNERFDPRAARRAMGTIMAGATLGGFVAGIATEAITDAFGMAPVCHLLAIACVLSAAAVRAFARDRRASPPAPAPPVPVVAKIVGEPYLRMTAGLVLILALAGALVDYALKVEAQSAHTSGTALAAFFGRYYAVLSLLTFVVQAGLTPRLLTKHGLAGTLAVFPVALTISTAAGAFFPALWVTAAARGAELVLSNSTHRSAYELIYTPLERATKRAVKAVIDTICSRAGDALGGALILASLQFLDLGASARAACAAAAVASAAALALVARIHGGYLQALGDSLRRRVVPLPEPEHLDATTRNAVLESRVAIDRRSLVGAIDRLRAVSDPADRRSSPAAAPGEDPFLTRARALLSAGLNPGAAREALRASPDHRLAALYSSLLRHPALEGDAFLALKAIAPQIVGQLTDLLLDPRVEAGVRSRIPRLLERAGSPRAIGGLILALDDGAFEIRRRSAAALLRLRCHRRRPLLSAEAVEPHVQRALETPSGEQSAESFADEESPLLDTETRRAIDPRIEHAFTLLALAFDPHDLSLALRAIASGDSRASGTALEFLENLFPDSMWQKLSSFAVPVAAGRV